jgi:hypothetical protein
MIGEKELKQKRTLIKKTRSLVIDSDPCPTKTE